MPRAISGVRRNECVVEEALQDTDEARAGRLKLVDVVQSHATYAVLAVPSQLDQHLAPIICSPEPNQKSAINQAINKPHGAVVLELHSLGQSTDRGMHAVGQTLDGQQKLLLLRLESGLARGIFAKTQKTPDLVTELGHRLEVGLKAHGKFIFIS